jgi:hypothetical protein
MIGLGISLLWLAIGIIVLGAIIYILLMVVRRFFPGMDANVDYAVWAIFGILILIYVLMMLNSGGHAPAIFR